MTVGRANLVNKTELQALCGRLGIGGRCVCVRVCEQGALWGKAQDLS